MCQEGESECIGWYNGVARKQRRMLDQRLQALLQDLEQLTPGDQQQLADQIEQWLDDLEWKRVLNEPGPGALYEAAVEEIQRGETQPLRLEDFTEE
jgi:hypothetical protein